MNNSIEQTATDLSIRNYWAKKLFSITFRNNLKIARQALCYDAGLNLYSVDPSAIPANKLYSMELGAKALIKVWPFIHDNLLEIGCGNKPYVLLINSLVSKYIGIDLPNWIEQDQSDCWADGLTLPFKYESFDTVLSLDMLNKVASPTHLFREANRVLKRHGHFVVMVSNEFSITDRPVFANYTADGLRMLAEQNGFNVQVLNSKGKKIPYFINSIVQTIFYGINLLRKSESKNQKPNTILTMFERILRKLQKILLKVTPEKSINCGEELSEINGRNRDSRFHMGYMLVAKKVFNLNEFSY